MMRFTHTIATGAGLLFVVPAVAGDGKTGSLRAALAETTRSIEILSGISERVETGDDEARRMLVHYTEPAEGDERERDEAVFELRQDINHLQIRLDTFGAPGSAGAGAPAGREVDAQQRRPQDALKDPLLPAPTGLGAETLELLAGIRAPGSAPAETPERGSNAGAAKKGTPITTPVALEPTEDPGYSADPVLHARACLRAGLYAKGLEVLAKAEENAESKYWRARLLEESGSVDKAIELYAAVAQLESPLAASAGELQQFLVWKRDFEKTLPGNQSGSQSGSKPASKPGSTKAKR